MILTGNEIEKEVLSGKICINPFNADLINPNSYNYRLGNILHEVISNPIDSKKEVCFKKHKIGANGYLLKPGKLYLGHTFETIGSDYYVTSLIGRSSVGRLGLFLQITADLGHIGAKHCWTLELEVVQPLRVYSHMKIGQVSFWVPTGKNIIKYDGKYAKHTIPHCSEMFLELGVNK